MRWLSKMTDVLLALAVVLLLVGWLHLWLRDRPVHVRERPLDDCVLVQVTDEQLVFMCVRARAAGKGGRP